MKRSIIVVIFLLCICASALIQGCYKLREGFSGALEGQILLRNTEIPISNVLIKIESLSDSSYFEIYSDENGKYHIDSVHFGLNKVVFQKKNYQLLIKYADIRKDDTFLLNVELKEVAFSKLIYAGVQVMDAQFKKPIPGALVDMYVKDGLTDYEYWDFYGSHYADDQGKTVFFMGSLNKKGSSELEVRIAAKGYCEGILNYTIYYQDHQDFKKFELMPYEQGTSCTEP